MDGRAEQAKIIFQRYRCFVAAVLSVTLSLGFGSGFAFAEAGGQPRTFLLNRRHLDIAKQLWLDGDPTTTAEMDRLIAHAEQALVSRSFSVTYTPEIAPSGDPHDLVSYGYYCWPTPNAPDGRPWICRDGHGNPDSAVDWDEFTGLTTAVQPLSLAYYFTGDERYAEKAASLFRTWFLNEDTRMNPRMEYSDVIPGTSRGSFGVPALGNNFGKRFTIDAAGILEASPSWTREDREGLQQWISEFTEWAETSYHGYVQRNEPSNHGTNYDFVFTMFALYNDDRERAEANFMHYVNNRLPGQIAEDGSNPLEMLRANNLLYHRYNLERVFDLAALGANNGIGDVDLFHYETADGRGPRMQLDFILPYMLGEQVWDKWPSEEFAREPIVYYDLLRKAATFYQDEDLLDAANRFGFTRVLYTNLTHPAAAVPEPTISVNLVDTICSAVANGINDPGYDLNDDGILNMDDVRIVLSSSNLLIGDADRDGRVGFADFSVLASNFGRSGKTWSDGDFADCNGVVNFLDFIAFSKHFGATTNPNSPASVPEPSALVGFGLLLVCIPRQKWQRRG